MGRATKIPKPPSSMLPTPRVTPPHDDIEYDNDDNNNNNVSSRSASPSPPPSHQCSPPPVKCECLPPFSCTRCNLQLHTAKSAGSEARAHAKAKKARQDDLEALQITFYEIEAWIEKTQPVLKRMTGELDKASVHFEQLRPKTRPTTPQSPVPLSPPITPSDARSVRSHFSQPPSSFSSLSSPPPLHQTPITVATADPAVPTPTGVTGPTGPVPLSNTDAEQVCQRENTTLGDEQKPVSWVFSFNPSGGLKLETNITSVDQLVDAVDKFSLLVHPGGYASIKPHDKHEDADRDPPHSPTTHQHDIDPSIEYWEKALDLNPCKQTLSPPNSDPPGVASEAATNMQVPREMLERICQVYWDCLHPKICVDWKSFWNRYSNPTRNLLCVNSGLALAFIHFYRHDSKSLPNAKDIGTGYFERTRTLLADCFDTPDLATVEALMNLGMFQVLQKQGSQARLYVGFAIRVALRIGMHRRENLPKDPAARKHQLRLFMVMYYYDFFVASYVMQPPVLDDAEMDIDFAEMLIMKGRDTGAGAGETSVVGDLEEAVEAKDFFFVHQCALLRISKRIQHLAYNTHHHEEDNARLMRQVTAIEVELTLWYKHVSSYLRFNPCIIHWLVPPQNPAGTDSQKSPSTGALASSPSILSHGSDDPESTTSNLPSAPSSQTDILREKSSILLMLQYKTQWILLHKAFLPRTDSPLSPPATPPPVPLYGNSSLPPSANSPAPIPNPATTPQSPTAISHFVCTRSADTIVELADRITRNHGWCVFQQFINCLYQASTIHCRNALSPHRELRRRSRRNIRRVIDILEKGPAHYGGLPGDLITCLKDFLNEHGEAGDDDDDDDSVMDDESEAEKAAMKAVCEAKMFSLNSAAAAAAAAAADRCCAVEPMLTNA